MELVRQRAQRLTLCSFWHPDGHGRGCDNVSDHICIGLTWMHGGVMLMAEGLLGKSNGRSCTINFSKVFQHVPKKILRIETLNKKSVIEEIVDKANDYMLPGLSEAAFLDTVSEIMDATLDKLVK
ncbi:hypothetical protein ACS0TY_006666 [Phlomoides rotata]